MRDRRTLLQVCFSNTESTVSSVKTSLTVTEAEAEQRESTPGFFGRNLRKSFLSSLVNLSNYLTSIAKGILLQGSFFFYIAPRPPFPYSASYITGAIREQTTTIYPRNGHFPGTSQSNNHHLPLGSGKGFTILISTISLTACILQ